MIALQVEAALVEGPLQEPIGALWGTYEGRSVVALGPPAERAAVPDQQAWTVPAGVERDEALPLPFLAAVARIRSPALSPPARVLVVGSGLAASLAERVLRDSPGARVERARPGELPAGTFDALVDASGNPARWNSSLARVNISGEAVLLIPPGPQRRPFDFYPGVHRRSLRLRVHRFLSPDHWPPHPESEQTRLLSRIRSWRRELEESIVETAVSPGRSTAPDPGGRALRLVWR